MFGASDDLLEFRGAVHGELGCYNREVVVRVLDKGAGCYLRWRYASTVPGGVWTCELAQLDEDVALPALCVGWDGYSVQITTVLDTVEAAVVKPGEWPADDAWAVPT
jgi:hypothetical protein